MYTIKILVTSLLAVFLATISHAGNFIDDTDTIAGPESIRTASDNFASFGPPIVLDSYASGAGDVSIADLNSDGKLDIVYSSYILKTLWLRNLDGGSFFHPTYISEDPWIGTKLEIADLNGDGHLDALTVGGSENDSIVWQENTGNGVFLSPVIISTEIREPIAVFAIDLDGDSDQDVISASEVDSMVVWFENDGAGSFGALNVLTSHENYLYSIFADDLDGDGMNDILASTIWEIFWFRNLGGGVFSEKIIIDSWNGVPFMHTADIDGDDYTDLIAADYSSKRLLQYEFDTTGSSVLVRKISTSGAYPGISLPADMNKDGYDDIITVTRDPNKIIYFDSWGQGVLGGPQLIADQEYITWDLDVGDLDQDGDLDIVYTGFRDIIWQKNTGIYVSSETGKEGNPGNDNLSIYPNPVHSKLTVSFFTKQPDPVSVSIYTIHGILQRTYNLGIPIYGQNEYVMDVSDYSLGLYIISVESGGEKIGHGRVLVQ